MMRDVGFLVLILVLVGTLGFGRVRDTNENAQSHKKDVNVFAANEFFPKGGIGAIGKGGLYVDLKSAKNELILSEGKRWTGQSVPTSEVAVVFEGGVWSSQTLPQGFDLSRSILVSFEKGKVRFFDFGEMAGGYYSRPKDLSER